MVFPGRFRFPKIKVSRVRTPTVYAPGCVFFMENGVDLGKPRPQTSDLAWVRYHQENINVTSIILLMLGLLLCSSQRRTWLSYSYLWLYISSISQSYRGFTGFGGICSGIPRLRTESGNSRCNLESDGRRFLANLFFLSLT